MPGTLVELQRCRDSAAVQDIIRILDAEGIPHRMGSDAPCVDVSTIGTGHDAQVIVSIREEDYEAARAAMERDSLEVDLPPDHYLLTSTDDEIAEIIAQPGEWSAFDVAHARRIMSERGIVPASIEIKRQERLQQRREGKRASAFLIGFGWVAVLLGGYLGVIIAWSLCYSKERTPEGEFPTYDARSRAIGRCMLFVAVLMTLVFSYFWFLNRSR